MTKEEQTLKCHKLCRYFASMRNVTMNEHNHAVLLNGWIRGHTIGTLCTYQAFLRNLKVFYSKIPKYRSNLSFKFIQHEISVTINTVRNLWQFNIVKYDTHQTKCNVSWHKLKRH